MCLAYQRIYANISVPQANPICVHNTKYASPVSAVYVSVKGSDKLYDLHTVGIVASRVPVIDSRGFDIVETCLRFLLLNLNWLNQYRAKGIDRSLNVLQIMTLSLINTRPKVKGGETKSQLKLGHGLLNCIQQNMIWWGYLSMRRFQINFRLIQQTNQSFTG